MRGTKGRRRLPRRIPGSCASSRLFFPRPSQGAVAVVERVPAAATSFGSADRLGRANTNSSGERVMDARAVAAAGVFPIVLEKIPEPLAREITSELSIPTIGISASVACDGQILVVDDMLGLFSSFRPTFVKRYAEFAATADIAIETYAQDVIERRFPATEHEFGDSPKAAQQEPQR
ncbi:3-methyl-2-oxobutanoate hydroxymethyltransferase [Rhizobium sp. 1AS11]|nr:3-methyl-2-oxobutanoate hydroxymethyltransferase [Rhizobium acaciae]MCW1410689.1 3-methyl-2-oxobutanoate hydroxymethyltransferase [Rhizobium acaciae]MCW1743012.1 3-methyl-2-oxobutanoate hydroxymethyltransferase [Rhizobium acaciae]